MKPTRVLSVPTGKIATAVGGKDKLLEALCVADYGKDANLKASFMGLDKEVMSVEHQSLLPLSDKMVITISTQYGCSMGCSFCDVPAVGKGVNVTLYDLIDQVDMMMKISGCTHGKRLNIHFARMGEPTFNKHILTAASEYKEIYKDSFDTVHPVVSTMMPKKNKELLPFLTEWMRIKNEVYNGEAGLQLSINSTKDVQRDAMFNNSCLNFAEVGEIAQELVRVAPPVGRKITLNFALANYEISPVKLLSYFDPKFFVIKLTPMHITNAATNNGVDYVQDYRPIEDILKSVGYDVIVFVPSHEEDAGRITCGNAVLSGTVPETAYTEHNIPDGEADWLNIINL